MAPSQLQNQQVACSHGCGTAHDAVKRMSIRGIRWNENAALRYKHKLISLEGEMTLLKTCLSPPTACIMTPFPQTSWAASKLPMHMRTARSHLTLHVYIRLEFLTTLNTKITVFWDVTPRIVIDTGSPYPRSTGTRKTPLKANPL